MPSDDVWEKLRKRPVPWDDVRERRVLKRALEAPREKRGLRASWIVAGTVAAAVAVIATVALVHGDNGREAGRGGASGGAEAEQSEQATAVALDGAGQAVLMQGASVALEQRTPTSVIVVQARGRVRYEVDRDAKRQVTVKVGGVEIEVIGTVFTVELGISRVSVAVERGLVRLNDGQREVEIGAGEEISVARSRGREKAVAVSAASVASTGEAAADPSETLEADLEPDSSPQNKMDQFDSAESADETNSGGEGVVDERDRAEVSTDSEVVEDAATGSPKTIEEMLAAVDAARRKGNPAEASRLLDEIVRTFPGDPRSSTALFTMGNVERARGRHAKAARAFRRCWRIDPSGPLAEDARAEAAASWSKAGRDDWAAEAARRYLAIYPEGTHAARMERLIE